MKSDATPFGKIDEFEVSRLPSIIKRLLIAGNEEQRLIKLLKEAVEAGKLDQAFRLASALVALSSASSQVNNHSGQLPHSENCASAL